MKNLKIAGCVLFLFSALTSCDKNEDFQADVTNHHSEDRIKVINDRLVFPDEKTFVEVRESLWQKSPQELDAWEKQHSFVSVRSLLPMSGIDTIPNLKEEFGFPSSYAALISARGEYQIGNKIYWFNKGFKYQVNSENELKNVKSNPSSCLTKFIAGIKLLKREFADDGSSQNRTIRRADETNGDRRYVSNAFDWDGRSRRLTIETFIYNEEITGQLLPFPPPSYVIAPSRTFYSAVVLSIYREYYNRRWYRGGEALYISYNLNGDGKVNNVYEPGSPNNPTPVYNSPVIPININASSLYYTGSGNFTADLVNTPYAYNPYYPLGYDWSYEVSGNISVRIANNPDFNEQYTISGYPLW